MDEKPNGAIFYHRTAFEAEVTERFGMLPNFFRSASAAPELIQKLWSFAQSGYLDNPIPALFKERLFVMLSRLCPMRYCIVRHVGFLLGNGRPAGDAQAPTHRIADVIRLLKQPTPWNRDMSSIYAGLERLTEPLADWPEPWTEMEDSIFACAAVVFSEPARGETARLALMKALGARRFEYLAGLLAFIRTAHYWTMLHPEIETEEDVRTLMRDHAQLARLLIEDPEADRCEMGPRLFNELIALRELNEREELKKAKAALEEKDRQKDQFIAILAHELRNPLAAIRSAADALNLMNLDDARVESLRTVLDRQSAAMARMLDDLFDAARIAFGKISVELDNIDFRDLVRELAGENAPHVKAAGIEFECEIADVPCYVRGDRIRLRQIIDNLLSNAIKFTPAPGRIAVRLWMAGGYAILRIEDSGVGFDSALAARLFEPFVQQEQSIDRLHGGLGLGLGISSTLAKLHGGSLSGESSGAGRGAAFTLTLPLGSSPAKPIQSIEELPRIERRRVLLVEDNEDAADALSQLIQLMGCDIDVAYDGQSALALAVAAPPDLVLCDVGLPGGMDGYAVAREARADPRLDATRLIAVSGYSQPKDHADAKQAGFDQLVSKPITIDMIEALLHSCSPKS
jgi:signal transduction histidine kinase/ActR/RegA family two-component response regulator